METKLATTDNSTLEGRRPPTSLVRKQKCPARKTCEGLVGDGGEAHEAMRGEAMRMGENKSPTYQQSSQRCQGRPKNQQYTSKD